MNKTENETIALLDKNKRILDKVLADCQLMISNRQRGVNVDCPKCGAFIDDRDDGCLACDFFDRLAAKDKIRV